ncbi:MAG: killer suppression protein [Patescibacteria group bacterium]|nr:killer suppression protein [Patescibacteria group bacterium]
MEIVYKNKKLQKLADNHKKLYQKFGKNCGELIILSLTYLNASTCLADIPTAIKPHPLKGKHNGKFAVDTKHPYRLIFEPKGKYNINDYSTIKSIVIIDLNCDYH